MGFENNGSSSDHCFYFGTLALPDREEYVYHGEGVAFSTCCQLVMQGASNEQLDEVYRFCRDVGLPITFDDMHLSDLTDEEYDIMTKAALEQVFMANQPFEVTYEKVLGAYAKYYLCTTDYSIVEIAERVGFTSPRTLYKLFRQYEGLSLSQYRKQHKKASDPPADE